MDAAVVKVCDEILKTSRTSKFFVQMETLVGAGFFYGYLVSDDRGFRGNWRRNIAGSVGDDNLVVFAVDYTRL